MKTRTQAIIWAQQQVNKSLNMDGKYGAQCVDLIWYFQQYLGVPIQWVASARQFWDRDYGNTAQKVSTPQPGDIAVWGGKGDGHSAIVVDIFPGGFHSVDQNFVNFSADHGAPAKLVKHDMKNVLGFIRYNFIAESQPTPAPAPAPAPPAGQPTSPGQITIKKGDTFWGLENAHGWPHGTLQQLNPRVPANRLQIGQVISAPTAAAAPAPVQDHSYVVVPGDTLSGIAKKLGIANWRTLYDKNRPLIGADPNLIRPGQRLLLP